MRKFFITVSMVLILPIQLLSAPSVVSVDQAIHGQTTVITCTSAGTKSPAAPLIWDSYEWGSQGDDLDSGGPTSWVVDVAGGQEITLLDKYAGTRSAHWQYTDSGGVEVPFRHVWKNYGEQSEIFFSYKFKYDIDGGAVFKFPRIGADAYYTTNTKMVMTGGNSVVNDLRLTYDYNDYDTSGGNLCGTESSSCDGLDKRANLNYNQWYGMELYNKLSNPGGTANGVVSAFVDGVGVGVDFGGTGESENIINRASGDTSPLEFILIGWSVTYPDTTSNFYVDDVYIDNTKSKVILCNESTYGASTVREMQPPTAWNASGEEVTVTFNAGAFSVGETAYVVIMDSTGDVSPGSAVIIASQETGGAPTTIGTGSVINVTSGSPVTIYPN